MIIAGEKNCAATMKLPTIRFSVLLLGAFLVLCGFSEFVYGTRGNKFVGMKLVGVYDIEGTHNSVEIDSLARFAVEEHNKKEVFSLILYIAILYPE